MKITSLHIRNFKSVRELSLRETENALILVGQNNTGKTTVLDAVRAAMGEYRIHPEDFREDFANIEISVSLELTDGDLEWMHQNGIVSQYKRREAWLEDFSRKRPSSWYLSLPPVVTSTRRASCRT